MKRVILIRYGEIGLKGLNKGFFIDTLIRNIKSSMRSINNKKLEKIQGRFLLQVEEEDLEFAIHRLLQIFGIASISVATVIDKDLEAIKEASAVLVEEKIQQGQTTFKVQARRGDKSFPMTSPELNGELGGYLLKRFDALSVDVHQPQFQIYVEIREKAYVYTDILPGKNGLPVGTGGKAALLVSGGIDSPVAGYMIASRGVEVMGVHFHSYPYTSDRAKEKVIKLMEKVAVYAGKITLFVVPFTEIQLAIGEFCDEKYSTLIMRRYMMKIATRIGKQNGASALITGESIGQVASQTLESLMVTNAATDLPVFRPVIGMDKHAIIRIAEEIDTFETSILPYEDCCTIFVPKHPQTKPKMEHVLKQESYMEGIEEMMERAIAESERLEVYPT
ncbi:tRNA 4-thiouridine(8) synthase ThiI [Alkalibacter rhizosphaerae]|uniref:Probable tRNA sulfurtransferase n=1 Tax=Alkalibacter rhizosphaerae TaxID=2815577 RepID=A0A974XF17_9FIRM|nr:tRNA uracil 4-sulfurtransferase ThiI [Alkalibacter rhizosphaerae]QSX08669.1 tRNA 4-thiouridine(8) synthase ThiI [Alkalibacter rhizosphaerae]